MEDPIDREIYDFLDLLEDITNYEFMTYQREYLTRYIKNRVLRKGVSNECDDIDKASAEGTASSGIAH